jgi:hypothetical protein
MVTDKVCRWPCHYNVEEKKKDNKDFSNRGGLQQYVMGAVTCCSSGAVFKTCSLREREELDSNTGDYRGPRSVGPAYEKGKKIRKT